jgi:hypothetical protein
MWDELTMAGCVDGRFDGQAKRVRNSLEASYTSRLTLVYQLELVYVPQMPSPQCIGSREMLA